MAAVINAIRNKVLLKGKAKESKTVEENKKKNKKSSEDIAAKFKNIQDKKKGTNYAVDAMEEEAEEVVIDEKAYKRIVKRLRKKMPFVEPFGDSFEVAFIEEESFYVGDEEAGLAEVLSGTIEGRKILGRSLGRFAEWIKNGKLDVPPHEFFHIYWLMRYGLDAMDAPLRNLFLEGEPHVVSAEYKNIIKTFKVDAYKWAIGAIGETRASLMTNNEVVEEYLARHVGEYYADRMKGSAARRFGNWIKLFWARLKKMFKPTPLTSNDIFNIIAEEFYTGKKVNESTLKGIFEELSTAFEGEQMSATRYEVEGEEAEESYPNWDTVKDADLSTVKRFNLSIRSLFGLPMLRSEVASVVMKAREIEILRKGGKYGDKFTDALNEFRNYILEALFVDKKLETRIGVFQEAVRKISGEERKVKGLKRRDLNNIINFYQFSTSSMLKSLKMELWAYRSPGGSDLYIELMPDDIHPITGKKQSKYVMKSFLDDMPGDIGAKTIILKFSNIVRDTGTDRVDRDGNKIKNYRGIATRQTAKANKALDVKLGKKGMSLIGPKGLDKAAFVIVHMTEEDFANAENIEEYLNKEINNKYMTDEDKASFIAHSEEMKEISPNVDAQIVAYHEWFKSLFGNEYLIWQRKALKDKPLDKEGTTANIMNRTRIVFSEGQTLRGLGGVSTMIIDPNDAIIEIPKSDGTGVNTYDLGKKWDGFMGWSSAMAYRVQDRWGRKPLRGEHNLTEVKPAIWHKTEKGLLAMKMNWFLPRPGMRITTKDGIEILRVEEDSKKNIRIVSTDGEIDTFATLEEAKLMWGEFDGATNSIINLSEESVKFIHGGDQKGKDAVAFPFGAVDLMLSPDLQADKEFLKGYKVAKKEMLGRAESAIRFLINSRYNPINFMKIFY